MKKPKILLVSYTIPENRMGGGLLLYRHFVQRNDYEIGILTSNPNSTSFDFHHHIPEPRLLSRLKRSRLATWFHDYTHLIHSRLLDRRLTRAAKEFKPDLILTVAETYLSHHAQLLARHLDVPLVSYFMDWAHYASCQHKWAFPIIDRKFRKLYRQSDLALCISEGMMDELGSHPNAQVVYPTGADLIPVAVDEESRKDAFEFCFAGNLAHWYGEQVANIINLCEEEPNITLRVFGAYHNWAKTFERDQRDRGVYMGFKPFEELIPYFQRTDAFLLPMGFDPDAALIERTSFKTKFLDYLLFEKPVVIWGPEYCTAIRIAREYNSALCITDPHPEAAIAGMKRLSEDPVLREELISNSKKMRDSVFNNESVYRGLKEALDSLILRSAPVNKNLERHS